MKKNKSTTLFCFFLGCTVIKMSLMAQAGQIDVSADSDSNNLGLTDAQQKEADLKEQVANLNQQIAEGKANIAEMEKQFRHLQGDEAKAAMEAKADDEKAIQDKIARHKQNIKDLEDQINQEKAAQKADEKVITDKASEDKKTSDAAHQDTIKGLEDQKKIEEAKEAARTKELAAIKGSKSAAPSSQNKNGKTQNTPAGKVRPTSAGADSKNVLATATVQTTSAAKPKNDLFGGIFSKIEEKVDAVTSASGKIEGITNKLSALEKPQSMRIAFNTSSLNRSMVI